MGKGHFEFRHFTVRQELCAMKVGTDGTLLGAWASMPGNGGRVLDIGTGTGLIALMMAQRFPSARITAIDIDPAAVLQARQNVISSPFAERIQVIEADIAHFRHDGEPFDAIVTNPPYFEYALECPDSRRTTARHTSALSYATLMDATSRLLTSNGYFSLIIPDEFRKRMLSEAHLRGFFVTKTCAIKTTPSKEPKRHLIELRRNPVNQIDIQSNILEISPGRRSPWYQALTQDFYLR